MGFWGFGGQVNANGEKVRGSTPYTSTLAPHVVLLFDFDFGLCFVLCACVRHDDVFLKLLLLSACSLVLKNLQWLHFGFKLW